MKFFLIVAFVIALALGSQAASLVKRESPDLRSDFEKITSFFQDFDQNLKALETPDLANKAKSFFEEKGAQLQPMFEKLHEQVNIAYGNIGESIKLLTTAIHAQVQVANMHKFLADHPAPSLKQ